MPAKKTVNKKAVVKKKVMSKPGEKVTALTMKKKLSKAPAKKVAAGVSPKTTKAVPKKAVQPKSVKVTKKAAPVKSPKITEAKKPKKIVAVKATKAKPTKVAAKPVKTIVTKATSASNTSLAKVAKSSSKLEARVTAMHSANLSTMGIPHYVVKPGEDYMNDSQRKHIERILVAWRQSLMEEVDRTVSHMKDEAANFPDSVDRASQEEEFSLELRTRDRERKLIKKIEDAMERLREDEFGYCETCGVEIGIARLEARPTATLCIDCKTLAEIKEKQTVGG